MKLRNLAHSRAGDKGNIANVSVIAYQESDYGRLRAELTEQRIRKYFGDRYGCAVQDISVRRYELPNIHALNFVITGLLAGGVTRSLVMDAHGKSLSGVLLDMEVDDDQPRG